MRVFSEMREPSMAGCGDTLVTLVTEREQREAIAPLACASPSERPSTPSHDHRGEQTCATTRTKRVSQNHVRTVLIFPYGEVDVSAGASVGNVVRREFGLGPKQFLAISLGGYEV